MRIEVLKNKSGKWFWRIVAKNGRILAHSQAYASKQGATSTASAVLHDLFWVEAVTVVEEAAK